MNNKTVKQYKTAPLPFQGQKRNFVEQFQFALYEFKFEKQIDTVIDLFGGSGLLSHAAKRMFPDLRVIYNDFDDFHLRLNNTYTTNRILNKVRNYLVGHPREKKLSEQAKKDVLEMIREEQKQGYYIDFVTLSSSLMFSGRYANTLKDFASTTLYNNVKKSDYEVEGYLDGLEIVKQDYKQLFEQYKRQKNVLFIIDPPYLSTDTKTYNSDSYWKLRDYLDVLKVLTHDNYIFFTSDKSCLVELCQWFSENCNMKNPFADAILKTHANKLNYHAGYLDMMLYRKG